MLTIGRALLTNPGSADPRRGDRGPRAAHRARDLEHPRRHPHPRHRDADRRQELPIGHGDRRSQRDPGQGARGLRGRQPNAACAAGDPSATSRGLNAVRRHRVASDRVRANRGRPAIAARRSSSCTRDWARSRCGETSPNASRARRSCDAIVYSRHGYGNSDPLTRAASRPLHARRGARSRCRSSSTASRSIGRS